MKIDVLSLSYTYPNGQAALRGCSFGAPAGSVTALLGPNGSGKSTALKCINGLVRMTAGSVAVGGKDVARVEGRELARIFAYVPQQHVPPFPFTVGEVVLMGRTPHLGSFLGPSAADRDAAWQAMERVGIEGLADRCYTELSGGQRQLVLLARALAQDTPVLVLDEPTSALDFHNQLGLWAILQGLGRQGKTVIATTHDPNHAVWFCAHAVVLKEGRTVAEGPADSVIDRGLLRALYGAECEVASVNGMRVIMPSGR